MLKLERFYRLTKTTKLFVRNLNSIEISKILLLGILNNRTFFFHFYAHGCLSLKNRILN